MRMAILRRLMFQAIATGVPVAIASFAFESGPTTIAFAAEDDFTELEQDINRLEQVDDRKKLGALVRLQQADQLEGGVFGAALTKQRRDLDARMDQNLRRILQDYRLSKLEYESLRLASRADRIRFDKEVEEIRNRYESSGNQNGDYQATRQRINTLFKLYLAQPQPEQFFGKVVNRVLKDRVAEVRHGNHDRFSTDQLRKRHQADVEAAVRAVERFVDLRQEQHESLIHLLLQETEPAKVFGDFDDIIVKYRLAQLSDDKLKPLFDDEQWPKAQRAFDNFREFGPFLKKHRLVDASVAVRQTGAVRIKEQGAVERPETVQPLLKTKTTQRIVPQ